MIIILFDDDDLKDLILRGSSQNKLYKKLSKNTAFMKNLISAYNRLRTIENTTQLKMYGSLNYEKLKYNLSGKSSIRIGFNTKYRLVFEELDNGIIINLIEINEHYGDK